MINKAEIQTRMHNILPVTLNKNQLQIYFILRTTTCMCSVKIITDSCIEYYLWILKPPPINLCCVSN